MGIFGSRRNFALRRNPDRLSQKGGRIRRKLANFRNSRFYQLFARLFRVIRKLIGGFGKVLTATSGAICAISLLVFVASATALTTISYSTTPGAEFDYYLTTYYDGVDKVGDFSGTATQPLATLTSDVIHVEDQIPAELDFKGFIIGDDGTLTAVRRDNPEKSCTGEIVGGAERGIHFDETKRVVYYDVQHLQAGCMITVGVSLQAPQLNGAARMDFYNTATVNEGVVSSNSDTIHIWMGDASITKKNVTYSFAGDVPPVVDVPLESSYNPGQIVAVTTQPQFGGYTFKGWSSDDVAITNNRFTMPNKDIEIVGTWEKNPTTPRYTVSYHVNGMTPDSYAPLLDHTYMEGDQVRIDTMRKDDKVDNMVFNGWETDSGVDISDVSFVMPAHDVVIYGSFSPKTHKLSYMYSGGDLPASVEATKPAEREVMVGEDIVLPEIPDTDNWHFNGWNYQNDFSMPNYDVIVNGSWIEVGGFYSPEVTVSVDNPKSGYNRGDQLTFTVTVKNNESFEIKDVILEETFPNAVISDSANADYIKTSDALVRIPSIPAGATKSFKVNYTIPEDANFGDSQNVIKLQAAQVDNDYMLSQTDATVGTANFFVIKNIYSLDMSAQIVDAKANYREGDKINVQLSVTNNNDFVMRNVDISHNFEGLKFLASTYGNYYTKTLKAITIPTIDINQTILVNAELEVTSSTPIGEQNVKFKMDSAEAPEGYMHDTTKESATNLAFTVIDKYITPTINATVHNPAEAYFVGDIVDFDIIITNPSDADINSAIIAQSLSGARFITDNDTQIENGNAKIANIAARGSKTLHAQYVVTGQETPGSIRNDFEIQSISASNGYALNTANEYKSSASFNAKQKSTLNLSTTMLGTNNTYLFGETAQFKLTVSNESLSSMQNIIIKHLLDGAEFTAGRGYEIVDATHARISALASKSSLELNVKYDVVADSIFGDKRLEFAVESADMETGYDFVAPNNVSKDFTTKKVSVSPEVTVRALNPKEKYEVGDEINFEVKVKNNSNVILTNITLRSDVLARMRSSLTGAVFTEGEGYGLVSASEANIPTIPVGAEVILNAMLGLTDGFKNTSASNTFAIASLDAPAGYEFAESNSTHSDFVILVEGGVDPPKEEPQEKPSEEPTDVPSGDDEPDEPADKPSDKPADEPSDEPSDEPTEEPKKDTTEKEKTPLTSVGSSVPFVITSASASLTAGIIYIVSRRKQGR